METAFSSSETPPLPQPIPAASPSRMARWLLATVLFTAYIPMQLVIATPFVLAAIVSGQFNTMDELMASELLVWLTLISAALAAVLTIVVAWGWPWMWQVFTSARITLADWVAWKPGDYLPLWSVPLITLPVMCVVGLGVALFFGPAEIDIQMQLFSTPGLQVASLVIVSTIVPVAEEIVFRGALYNALLAVTRDGTPAWLQHLLPFGVVTVVFASIHVLSGLVTFAAILQIALLSAYLTALRAVSGSVKASIIGHVVWNLTAAVMLVLANVFGI